MAAHHAGRHVSRAVRLSTLLRGFSLPHEVIATRDSKAILASMKAEYYKRAKQQHPDLVPDDRKEEAMVNFKVLQEEFQQAAQLLDEGVMPPSPGTGTQAAQTMYGGSIRQPMYHHTEAAEFTEGPRYPVHKHPQFDTATRIKCNVIFWSGLFCFLTFMREFLVWSAGSTYAWNAPADLHPFWIRRYQNAWADKAADDRKIPAKDSPEAMKEANVKEKVQKLDANRDRGMDEFYKKRRVSNVKRKYSPRGHGGIQM